jgi:putative acetyltransferase
MKYDIEKIRPEHDDAVCRIIKKVGKEYGAIGNGFGPSDDEVLSMSKYYIEENKSLYLVAVKEGTVFGGCGIAPFNNSFEVCELRKLFLLQESRGLGIGKNLTQKCLAFARSKGYTQCYLDTLSNMKSAIALYENLGFRHLKEPLGGTIHGACNVWMLKKL